MCRFRLQCKNISFIYLIIMVNIFSNKIFLYSWYCFVRFDKALFPFFMLQTLYPKPFLEETIWMWLFHRHPILVCYTSLNHQVNWMKRESREKAFTDLQYLRIWNIIRVLLVASKMFYALQFSIINCKTSSTISCLNYTFYAK